MTTFSTAETSQAITPAPQATFADPRTILVVVFVVNAVVLGQGSFDGVLAGGILTTFLLLLTPHGIRRAAVFLILFSMFVFGYRVLPTLAASTITAALAAVGFWFSRFSICIGLGMYAISAIRPTELTASLRAVHAPRWLVIPFAVMLRIFPVITAEARAIGDAMTLRGVRPTLGSMLAHPIRSGEMLMIPLLSTVVRAGDELAASAMLRGLGGPNKPSTITVLRFRLFDAVMLLAAAVVGYLALAPGTFQ